MIERMLAHPRTSGLRKGLDRPRRLRVKVLLLNKSNEEETREQSRGFYTLVSVVCLLANGLLYSTLRPSGLRGSGYSSSSRVVKHRRDYELFTC